MFCAATMWCIIFELFSLSVSVTCLTFVQFVTCTFMCTAACSLDMMSTNVQCTCSEVLFQFDFSGYFVDFNVSILLCLNTRFSFCVYSLPCYSVVHDGRAINVDDDLDDDDDGSSTVDFGRPEIGRLSITRRIVGRPTDCETGARRRAALVRPARPPCGWRDRGRRCRHVLANYG